MTPPFHIGVCYYPEHAPNGQIASDIDRIAEAGFTWVRMGEGAWSYWEREEGKFEFELFDRTIDLCRKRGIKVVMGTPTYTAPAWVVRKYPEVLRWNFERIPMQHGSRRNLNYTSPKYYELSDRLCTALAQHYRKEKQIIGWQLDNEFNCHMAVSYAPTDTLAFRVWLRERYGTIETLNEAWGTRFWSQEYNDFDQVDLPHPTSCFQNPTALLDESRFISDCVVRFARSQAKIMRKANPKWWLTHNALFENVDGQKLTKEIDFFSHDQYPLFYPDWTSHTFTTIQARSFSFPWGMMEQQSGPGGQMAYLHRTPKPGELRLWTYQSVAHGANIFGYFCWQTVAYGSEQHWHGLIDADGRDNRRLAEAVTTASELKALPKDYFTAPVDRVVAVVRDYDNEINERRINTYAKGGAWEQGRWQGEMGRRHVPIDFAWSDSDLKGYRVAIAPHLKIVDSKMVARWTKFVRSGGLLVLGSQSGSKDRNCHIVRATSPGLLSELAGIEVEEFTTVKEDEFYLAQFADGTEQRLSTVVEKLVLKTATPLAHWNGDDSLLGKAPAVTINKVGRGKVIYVGGYIAAGQFDAIIDRIFALAGIRPVVQANGSVEAISRTAGKNRYLTLLNHSATEQEAILDEPADEILSSAKKLTRLMLEPYGVAVLRTKKGKE